MKLNKFTTKEEAYEAERVDFQMWKDKIGYPKSKYWEDTLFWDEPRECAGGFWYYDVCPLGILSHEQVDFETVTFKDTLE